MKYAVVTFGCRVNQADSLEIESELSAAGAKAVSADCADLVIVNTCSVTASADQGARQTIRRIARENPAARIVATGCYATRCADEIAALPGVVAVVGNDRKYQEKWLTLAAHPAPDASGPCGRAVAPGLMGRTAWTLRVQTGCEESCSYCIIPTTRGPGRSRTIGDVLIEAGRVIEAGYREIVVTGVHLGSYGRDLRPRVTLADLVARLCTADRGDVLFRISSLEPMDFPGELLQHAAASVSVAEPAKGSALDIPQSPRLVGSAFLARSAGLGPLCGPQRDQNSPSGLHSGPMRGPRVAPHFHLPLQHASNRILCAMKRPYTLEYYGALVDCIRQHLPHASIGSDVIAGFPGERDEDFAELTAYLERSPLTHLHVFPYSDRPGTVAATLGEKVNGSVIKSRSHRLREISRDLQMRFREGQRGTVRPALTIEDGSVAVTDNYVRAPAPPGHARNEWVMVTL